jgi:predicted flap endonuclease-1-like 5' DNA nuclease
MRNVRLVAIEGIGETYGAKLAAQGLKSTADLLAAADTAAKRKKLAEAVGLTEKQILEWANRADLFRIKGVGTQFSDLLEKAGVDTVAELAKRVPENLHAKLLEVNAEKKLVRRAPTLKEVQAWVAHAKELPRALHY